MAEDSGGESSTSSDAEHDQFYVDVIQETIYGFAELLGEKTALMHARKAPINITPNGQVTGYYGRGREAFDMLITEYESIFGEEVADKKVRSILADSLSEEEKDLVPERVRPHNEQSHPTLLEQLRDLNPFSTTIVMSTGCKDI